MRKFLVLFVLWVSAAGLKGQGSGNTLTYNGSSQYIDLGTQVAANCRTVEFWFMSPVAITANSLANPISFIIRDFNNGSSLSTNEFGFYIPDATWPTGQGQIHFYRRVASASYEVVSNANTWQGNVWYHVAGVIDPVAGMQLYINGVLQNSTNTSTQPIQPQTGAATDMVAIATWGYWGATTGGRSFNGDIDEVRFWTTARTQAQVRDNMCRKVNPVQTGLQTYYRFDASSGTTLSDLTGNGYNGTLGNLPGTSWHYSSAPIGDTATNVYPASWTGQSLTLNYASGDDFTVSNITGSSAGAHIYRVASLPNSTAGLNSPVSDYYGIFLTGTSGNYDIAQTFSAFGNLCSANCQQLAARTHNAVTTWTNITPVYSGCSYTKSNESSVGVSYRAEYILSVANAVAPHILGNDTTLCSATAYTLNATSPNSTYQWSTGSTAASITVTQSGLYWVDITSNGCTLRDSVHVTLTPPLTGVTATAGSATLCAGQTTPLTAQVSGGSGNYTYTWTPGNSHTNPTQVSPQSTTVYTVTVSNGCVSGTATTTVQVNGSIPTLTLSPAASGCSPVCVTFSSTPTVSTVSHWLWNFGDGTQDTSLTPSKHCYATPGNYNVSLSYTTNTGCAGSVTAINEVTVFSYPKASFTASSFQTDILDPEIQFYDQSSGASTWQWNFGDSYYTSGEQNPIHTYPDIDSYVVTLVITNSHGCKDSIWQTVTITDAFTFYAPNSFTPDDDGLNDVFFPQGTGWDNASYSILIYDRWGNLAFSSKDPLKGWDGTLKNDAVAEDLYVWKASLKDLYGKEHQYTGTIKLIR